MVKVVCELHLSFGFSSEEAFEEEEEASACFAAPEVKALEKRHEEGEEEEEGREPLQGPATMLLLLPLQLPLLLFPPLLLLQ